MNIIISQNYSLLNDCALFKDKKQFQSEEGEFSCGSKQYPADFQTITVTNSVKPNMHVMSSPVEVTIQLL